MAVTLMGAEILSEQPVSRPEAYRSSFVGRTFVKVKPDTLAGDAPYLPFWA